MSEYIKRDALLNEISQQKVMSTHSFPRRHFTVNDVLTCIKTAPTVDVAPVVHAKWIEYPRPHYFKCSNCKYTVPYRKAVLHDEKREYNSCPSCGAKMDLEG